MLKTRTAQSCGRSPGLNFVISLDLEIFSQMCGISESITAFMSSLFPGSSTEMAPDGDRDAAEEFNDILT